MISLENKNAVLLSLLLFPITWGIYEFRLFRLEVKRINNTLKDIDKITKNDLDDYPLIKDLKKTIDNLKKTIKKVNSILK